MRTDNKVCHAGKSLILFFAPIVLLFLIGVFEELTDTNVDELASGYGNQALFAFTIILWSLGVLFAFLSFKSKEGHAKKAFAGLVLNLLALLAVLGVFSNYL